MKSLVEQKRASSVYSTGLELPSTLQPAEWAIMKKMIRALKPFEEITWYTSCAQATMVDTGPAVASLKAAKHMLLAAVCDRFKDSQTEPLYIFAIMVDACFKD